MLTMLVGLLAGVVLAGLFKKVLKLAIGLVVLSGIAAYVAISNGWMSADVLSSVPMPDLRLPDLTLTQSLRQHIESRLPFFGALGAGFAVVMLRTPLKAALSVFRRKPDEHHA